MLRSFPPNQELGLRDLQVPKGWTIFVLAVGQTALKMQKRKAHIKINKMGIRSLV